jgi:hypothetical protein
VSPQRKEGERKGALRPPQRKNLSRSRSPLERRVQFSGVDKEIPSHADSASSHLMRMKDARDAVPRKEGETRAAWKKRVFDNKRRTEAESLKKDGK